MATGRKKKWNYRRKFSNYIYQIERMIIKHIGSRNYAGSSCLAQLDRIYGKFMDCTD